MADPFVQASSPSTSPFDDMGTEQPGVNPGLPPKVIDKTARLASVALDPVMSTYAEMTERYNDIISKYGDVGVRQEAAINQQAQQLRTITGMEKLGADTNNPEADFNSQLALTAAWDEDTKRRQEYALEQSAYENIQQLATSDPVQAKLLMDRVIHGDPEDVIRDINVKKMIIMREVEKAGIEEKDQPWFMHAADFIGATIGDLTLAQSRGRNGIVDIDDSLKNWYDWAVSGNRQRNEAAELWSKNPAEFAKTMREQVIPRIKEHATSFGYFNRSTEMNLLTGLANTPDPWITNITDLGIVAGGASLFPLGKIASIPTMLARAGARKEAVDMLAATGLDAIRRGPAAAEKSSGVSVQEVITNLEPSNIRTGDPLSSVPVTGDVQAGMERGQALIDSLGRNFRQPGRMSTDEYEAAVAKEQARITEEIGRPLKDFVTVSNKQADGSQTLGFDFLIGKKRGGGFQSESSAYQQAQAFGIKDPVVIQDESGQYFIKHYRDMNEAGYYTTNLDVGLKNTGLAGRLFLGARLVGDKELQKLDRASANTHNAILTTIVQKYKSDIKLSFDEAKDLGVIATWGENAGVWLKPDELETLYQRAFNRAPSPKEVKGYQALRDLNDIEFAMRNAGMHKEKVIKGFETATFSHPLVNIDRENAIVQRTLNHKPEGRIFNASTGEHFHEDNPLAPNRFKEMGEEGYALISLESEKEMADGTTVKHFLIKRGEMQTERLRRDQMPYSAGGHRMYEDKYFVKQAREGAQRDTGKTFLKNPTTYITGTKAEVQRWATTMEHARQLFNAKAAPELLEEVLAPIAGMDYQAFKTLMEEGGSKHPFQATFDRELPSIYTTGDVPLDFVDLDESGFAGWARSNGRMYYSGKGEKLTDWQGMAARTIDPFETTNTAINNIANLASFSDYKISAVERWVKTYRDYLDTSHLPNGASDLTLFTEGQFRPNALKQPMFNGHTIKEQMEAQRDIIRRNIGWRTDWDRKMDMHTQKIADYIMGDDPESMRHAAAGRAIKWWDEAKPLAALRGLAFDLKLGLLNVAQFPLQIQTTVSTIALAGAEHGIPAMVNIPFLRIYLTKSGTEHFLNTAIEKGMHTLNGMQDYEYKAMMRAAKQSGFFEFGKDHQMINSFGPNAVYGGVRGGWDEFTRHTRFFFNEGETYNRIVAWQVAWKDVSRNIKYPKKMGTGVDTEQFYNEFMNNVALKADDYSMSMMSQSSAMWQKGILSIPTQFWAYNARSLEAMLGNTFTRQQRMRMFLAQTFFYGAAGVPVIGGISGVIKKSNGTAPDIGSKDPLESIYAMIDRGFLDEVAYHVNGADVLVGKRYGTGSWSTDLAGELLGMSPYGEKSFVDVVGGATYSIIKDTAGTAGHTLLDMVKLVSAESGAQDYPLVAEDIKRMAMNISTVSYMMKANMVVQYQAMVSNKGTLVATDLPTADAFYVMLGIQPAEQDEISAMSGYLKHKKEMVEEVTKHITNSRGRFLVDTGHRDEISAELNAFLRLQPEDVRVAALKKANQYTPQSLKEGLGQQMLKEQTQRKMIKDGQAN